MRELAIISDVHVGCRDVDFPMLWFTVTGINYSALQCLPWEEAGSLIRDNGVRDIKELNGRGCIVESAGGLMKFIELKK